MAEVDPELAIAVARAAGLDTGPLEAQIRQQAGGDDADRLRARIAELEAQVPAGGAEPATPHEKLARALNEAQSKWFSLDGGPDA